MTENTTEAQLPTEPVLPAGRDPLDDLTAGELGHIGKLMRCDPYAAVRNGSGREGDQANGQRWPALAHIAWTWAKRTDPRAKLQPFLNARPGELAELLRLTDTDDTDDAGAGEQPAEENPTDSPAAS